MGQGGGKPFTRRPPENPLGTQARLIALDTLLDVSQQDAYASLALAERLRRAPELQSRDRALVSELVYGTLERQLWLDHVLDHFLERKELDPVVRAILRMGAYQLLFLDRVPANAAVDEAVKLTRRKERERYGGLVNAILRNVDREREKLPQPDAEADPVGALSLKQSVPRWIVQRIADAYGIEQAREMLSYRPDRQQVVVRPNLERTTIADFEAFLQRAGLTFAHGQVPGAYRISQGGDLTRFPEYRKGLYSIQGESAMLAAQAVGAEPGWSVLDACAAPGGKTAVLAEAMHGTGRVYAWDLHAHRVALIRAMAQRLGLENIRAIERDATRPKEDLFSTMDAVLLDAPCSGLGVMWEKPDLKYRQTPEGVDALVEVQRELLATCAQYVKPGGVLLYATCSILPEENGDQVRRFLSEHPDFAPEGLAERVPEALRPHIEEGCLQILPHRDGLEGFFLCRMRRANP